MRKYQKILLLLSLILVLSFITVMARRSHNQDSLIKKDRQSVDLENQFPMVDYSAPDPADQTKKIRRRAKSKKYDNAQIPLNDSSGETVSMLDWEVGLSALPVAKSDAVVIARVTEAQAYLSDDKTNVYSEFTIQVDEIFKNNSRILLSPGSSVSVEREGGRVRFPSGNIVRQSTRNQGMPRVGRRYVLFLTHNFPWKGTQDQDLYLLTGYELRAGHVFPLDFPQGGVHPIATTYKEATELSLLNDLRSALANTPSAP